MGVLMKSVGLTWGRFCPRGFGCKVCQQCLLSQLRRGLEGGEARAAAHVPRTQEPLPPLTPAWTLQPQAPQHWVGKLERRGAEEDGPCGEGTEGYSEMTSGSRGSCSFVTCFWVDSVLESRSLKLEDYCFGGWGGNPLKCE